MDHTDFKRYGLMVRQSATEGEENGVLAVNAKIAKFILKGLKEWEARGFEKDLYVFTLSTLEKENKIK